MVSITVLTESEKSRITNKIQEFSNLTEDGSLMPYVFEEQMSDGDIEVRFFPTPEEGPVTGLYFEITVEESANWYEDLGVYGADNLRNGGDIHQALSEELNNCMEKAMGKKTDFIVSKGSSTFTSEITL